MCSTAFVGEAPPLPRVSTAIVGEAPPLPRVSTALVGEAPPLPRVSTALVTETPPLPCVFHHLRGQDTASALCVSTALVAKTVPLLSGPQELTAKDNDLAKLPKVTERRISIYPPLLACPPPFSTA